MSNTHTSAWVLLDRITSIAVLVAAGGLLWVLVSNRIAATTSAAKSNGVEDVSHLSTSTHGPMQGASDATVALIEFSDFQCPYCAQYFKEIYPQLQHDFIDTKKVRYIFRHLPIESSHPQAFKAAEAAACAGEQQRFWEMHDSLFRLGAAPTTARMMAQATNIGMDEAMFTDCLEGRMEQTVRADLSEASRLGVQATPSFFLGQVEPGGADITLRKRISGLQPYAVFKDTIDDLLKQTSRSARR